MSDRAFISYAREDQDFVLRLGNKLQERTVSIWLDQWDIPAGGDWDQAIDIVLHDCNRLLIILSPAAVASKQVRGELQTALEEHKLIVPLVYKTCSIPRVLRLIQHIDFTRTDLGDDVALDQVVRALGGSQTVFPQPRKDGLSQQFWRRRQLVSIMGTLSAMVLLIIGSFWYVWYPHSLRGPSDGPAQGSLSNPSFHRGNLQISANIDDVQVSIDGIKVGVARRAAPLFLTGIKPGQHRVRAAAKGYEPQEQRVNVVENEWSKVGFQLNRRRP